jgi:hypothetical protein
MEQQGIERPREESLTDEARAAVAEARQQAAAKLAEIEILHRDRMKGLFEPDKRDEEEQTYRLERRRIETERDHKIDKLRGERSA